MRQQWKGDTLKECRTIPVGVPILGRETCRFPFRRTEHADAVPTRSLATAPCLLTLEHVAE
jgi:hypothetical protein